MSKLGLRNQERSSSSSLGRGAKSSTIAAASPSVGGRIASAGRELIERLREPAQVGQLAGRRRVGRLTEAVDPDRRESERGRRDDVVEVRRADVHGRQTAGSLLE